jgi:hypothetical protein
MSQPNTFKIPIPKRQPVEVVVIQRADGSVVARTADELKAGDATTETAPRG